MKKLICLFSLLVLLLPACGLAPISAPTATIVPPPTSTPRPTETPLPPATAIPTPTESPSRKALLGLGYTEKDLEGITNISEGTFSFPGDTGIYNGIIGTKADGTKEIFAFKFSDNPNLIKLTGTEAVTLADQIHGKNFNDVVSSGGEDIEIFAISTGIVEDLDIFDGSGNVAEHLQTMLGITIDEKGFFKFVRAPMQSESASNPNINNFSWLVSFYNNWEIPESDRVYSNDELKGLVPKGAKFVFGIPTDGPKNSNLGGPFFIKYFYNNPNYRINEFLTSKGVVAPTDTPIILFTLGLRRD